MTRSEVTSMSGTNACGGGLGARVGVGVGAGVSAGSGVGLGCDQTGGNSES
ncbi:MAG: hypothetical protein QF579_02310 [Dehalococcoidia bacterium]|nr:hypothetical protein [Dehalococcoidia bacterium]